MAQQPRKAERRKAKLRLGISAPAGAGKTLSSLLIASGIGQKVGLIDTEAGSGDLYADQKDVKAALPNGYDVLQISAPFDPAKYIDAITTFEDLGYDVVILDSLSHAWAGAGGLLDKQGKIADKSGNSYAAWRTVTPMHNALVDKMLQSKCHIIGTMRAKTEYVQEKNEQGKTIVRKIGMSPVMRDGMEFEFTVFGEMDQAHHFSASKDRTDIFGDMSMVPSKKMGQMLLAWLNSGAEALPEPKPLTINERLGDEIPTFAEPPSLEQRAKEMGRAIDTAANEGQLNHEVLTYVKTMDEMAKTKPEWHAAMLAKIHTRRESIINSKPKNPRTKREPDVADTSDMNDPLPEGLQPDKSQAEQLTDKLQGAI